MTTIGQPKCPFHGSLMDWIGGAWMCLCCFSDCDRWHEKED